MQTDICEDP